jgi:hypothetical protein
MPPSGCLRSCKKCFRFRRRPQPRAHYSAISEVSRNHPDCDGPRRSHKSSVAAARNPPFLGKAKSLSGIPFREPILVPPHRYGPRCCSSIKRRGVTAPTFPIMSSTWFGVARWSALYSSRPMCTPFSNIEPASCGTCLLLQSPLSAHARWPLPLCSLQGFLPGGRLSKHIE